MKEDVEAVAERPLGRFIRADLDYVEGVVGAGGAPVVLPPAGDERAAEAVVESLDGLLLSGGSDLDPRYYGEEPVPELGPTIPERDAFEMALVGLALRRGMPVFGICRGMQVLNVALGGTLYQDLPSQWDGDVLKHRQATPKWQPTHEVEVRDGSYIAEVMGRDVVKVNSYHHQGIKDLAEGLVVTGRSADGVIEAVEAAGPLRALAARRTVARRGDARRRSAAGESLRGARLGGGAPRPAQGRCLGRASRAEPAGYTQGRLRNDRRPGFLRQVNPCKRHQTTAYGFETFDALYPGARRHPGGRDHQGDRPGPKVEMDAWTEAYLYAAARADHVRGAILPRLEAGENVLCERYLDSSLAYQGFGRGLGVEAVRALNAYAVGTVVPDRTFYLRLDHDERERRARELGAPPDRIEAVGAGFMRRVEEGFEELARLEPGRIEVLDASLSPRSLGGLVVGRMRALQYTRGEDG